jgi:hypothetical protein
LLGLIIIISESDNEESFCYALNINTESFDKEQSNEMNSEDNTYIASERGDELAIAIAIEKLAKPEARL